MMWVVSSETVGSKNGVNFCVVHIECDNIADLPAPDAYEQQTGARMWISSTAHVINDNSYYMLNGESQWIQQQPGATTYSNADIDAMLLLASTAMMRQAEEIPDYGNMDNYTIAGAYYSPNAARTATLYNRPWSGSGFKLLVFSISTTSKMQLYFPMSQTAHSIFQRNRISSGWMSYYEHEGTLIQTINPLTIPTAG